MTNDTMTIEEQSTRRFRPLEGFPGYYASSDGYVWSLRSPGSPWGRDVRERAEPKRLKGTSRANGGYLVVTLRSEDARSHSKIVHVLVKEAFDGPTPEGHVVRHYDGDPTNNDLTNLVFGTHADNEADKKRHDRHMRGERHHKARLTEADVIRIRADPSMDQFLVRETEAERLGVTGAALWDAWSGKSWTYLPNAQKRERVPRSASRNRR
jgi:hypothetical protein